MKPLPNLKMGRCSYLLSLIQASNLSFSPHRNHWQRAEQLHYCSHFLDDQVIHYRLYADLYARQGELKKCQDCLAKAEKLSGLAVTSHSVERYEWRLAHHYQRSAQHSQHLIQQGFLLMMAMYFVGCGVLMVRVAQLCWGCLSVMQ
jgi:hypothetical protein